MFVVNYNCMKKIMWIIYPMYLTNIWTFVSSIRWIPQTNNSLSLYLTNIHWSASAKPKQKLETDNVGKNVYNSNYFFDRLCFSALDSLHHTSAYRCLSFFVENSSLSTGRKTCEICIEFKGNGAFTSLVSDKECKSGNCREQE